MTALAIAQGLLGMVLAVRDAASAEEKAQIDEAVREMSAAKDRAPSATDAFRAIHEKNLERLRAK